MNLLDHAVINIEYPQTISASSQNSGGGSEGDHDDDDKDMSVCTGGAPGVRVMVMAMASKGNGSGCESVMIYFFLYFSLPLFTSIHLPMHSVHSADCIILLHSLCTSLAIPCLCSTSTLCIHIYSTNDCTSYSL